MKDPYSSHSSSGSPGWACASFGLVSQTRQLRAVSQESLSWENETLSSFSPWCSKYMDVELP